MPRTSALVANKSHCFVSRHTGQVQSEILASDKAVRWLYSNVRESAPLVYHWLTHSPKVNDALARLNFDLSKNFGSLSVSEFCNKVGLDLSDSFETFDQQASLREIFLRRIKYWESRPMPDASMVVCPSDSRVLVSGDSSKNTLNSLLVVKEKLFTRTELIGQDKPWAEVFSTADWAVFRLTPEKYHYNHLPVSGTVVDIYGIDGAYHACNPFVATREITPISKNGRLVTVIDTDVPNGTKVGLVAMVEVVALMIGRITQAYSQTFYDDPRELAPRDWVERGAVKARFEPGSSTVVLLFEPKRVKFCQELLLNQARTNVPSRYNDLYGIPMVETDVAVRSALAEKL